MIEMNSLLKLYLDNLSIIYVLSYNDKNIISKGQIFLNILSI